MAIRQYEVLGVREINSADTDEKTAYLDLKPVNPIQIKFKTPSQLLNLDIYRELKGRVVSIDTRQGEMNGEPWTTFKTDGYPSVQVDPREYFKGQSNNPFSLDIPNKVDLLVDESTGEVLKTSPKDENKPKSPLSFATQKSA